jgi:hypothetical protein
MYLSKYLSYAFLALLTICLRACNEAGESGQQRSDAPVQGSASSASGQTDRSRVVQGDAGASAGGNLAVAVGEPTFNVADRRVDGSGDTAR